MGTVTSPLGNLQKLEAAVSQIPEKGFQIKPRTPDERGTTVWNRSKNPNAVATGHPFVISPSDLSLDLFLTTCSYTAPSCPQTKSIFQASLNPPDDEYKNKGRAQMEMLINSA